jgi:prolyl oligopeptidase
VRKTTAASLIAALCCAAAANAAPSGPPVAPVRPVTDEYYGTKIVDPYRWMEDRNAPEFIAYMKAQGAYARAMLDRIPGRDKLQERIAAHTGGGVVISNVQIAGGKIFFMKRGPTENTFKLYVRDTAAAPERLLLDPDHDAKPGTHNSIDYYQPSQKGEKVAYGISAGGSENSVIHVINTATGKTAADAIDRCENGGIAWLPDASGFFFNRMAVSKPGAPDTEHYLNSRVYLHRLDTDAAKDLALIGTGVAGSPQVTPVDIPFVAVQPGSQFALAIISHGSEPALEILIAPRADVASGKAAWRKIADTAEAVTGFAFSGDKLFLLSHADAPRYKLVVVDARHPDWSKAVTAIPSSDRIIEDVSAAADGLYVRELDGGLNRLYRYDVQNQKLDEIALPAQGTLNGAVADPLRPGAVFGLQSWIVPQQWHSISNGKVSPLALAPPWADDFSPYMSEEVKAPARDGVMIPLSIIRRKDLKLDGKMPLWLTGYGAYGIALKPSLAASRLTLMEDGGIVAVCHVRGGGEFGEDWHRAGMLATKPNTYRDLIDCAQYLHQHGYGSPQTTAIEGRSAGGITVGMAMTERPDLFRVVFSGVGDSNALRTEFATDGAANSLEYGSVKTEAGFRALAAVDALSHVKDHTPYPAALFSSGLNDPRVAPWQPGKMASRLQVATSSGRPVLLLVDADAGHGMGSTKLQRDRETADQMAFLYWQIGKAAYQPKP